MSIQMWIDEQKAIKALNRPKQAPSLEKYHKLWMKCDGCQTPLYVKHLNQQMKICGDCGFHVRMNSLERRELIIDSGTWKSLDKTVSPCDPLEFQDEEIDYSERLEDTQKRTGLRDAIQTGTGTIDRIPVAVGIMDFNFMGGSMGSVVGEKITRLIEYATQEGLILLIVCASGGARMQEGILSLMQMAKISAALQIYHSANLLYLSVLTAPTTGGVTASFGMLGDVIFSEPKALIAFAGRRVMEEMSVLTVEEIPINFQTAEYYHANGLIDHIVERRLLKQALATVISFYLEAPFSQAGVIPDRIQDYFYFATEEKVRRKWNQFTSK